MIQKVIFDDEIVLYWERQAEYKKGCIYKIKYALETVYTDKTHFTIKKTVFTTEPLSLRVELLDEMGASLKTLAEETLCFANPKRRLDVTKPPYNAVGDGKTLNTQAIQKAIDDCGIDDCVYLPAGVFMTGALNLHSDMELFVDVSARLQGTSCVEDYLPKIKSRYEGIESECYRSLLNLGQIDNKGGYTTRNVIIRGGGSVLGGGRALAINTIERESGEEFNEGGFRNEKQLQAWRSRGRLLQASNCENVMIADVTIGEGAAWNLHFIYSKNILTCNSKIVSTNVNNGDGWDPDSCENCTIFNCDFNTRDDMIAIKSGKNPEGNIINRPSKHIKVFDCRCEQGHGLAIGSEMSGGVEDVCVWDCQMQKSRCGLEIKSRRERGGYVKNVRVYDSAFSILAIRSVDYSIDGDSAFVAPILENFYFENISLTGVCIKHTGETWNESAIILEGFDGAEHCLKDVRIKNVSIAYREGEMKQNLTLSCLRGVSIENIFCG